jgi:hypothetical protein
MWIGVNADRGSRLGTKSAVARANWKERPERESLTRVQWRC